METAGGGWTLVWSYSFTNYSFFSESFNAVTPRPNWNVKAEADVPISSDPPLHETDYNAILLTLETTRQTGPHQEQHKQLAGVSSGNWQLGRLAGWWHQLSDHQICDCHVQRDTCTFGIKSEYRQWTEILKHPIVLLFRRLHRAFLANSWSMRTKLVQPFERRGWASWKHFHSLVNEL